MNLHSGKINPIDDLVYPIFGGFSLLGIVSVYGISSGNYIMHNLELSGTQLGINFMIYITLHAGSLALVLNSYKKEFESAFEFLKNMTWRHVGVSHIIYAGLMGWLTYIMLDDLSWGDFTFREYAMWLLQTVLAWLGFYIATHFIACFRKMFVE